MATRDPRLEVGLARLREGRRQLRSSRKRAAEGDPGAESKARAALATLRSAMDWLEDTERFEEAHRELDRASRWVRRRFGCELHWTGQRYEQRCPVALAHTRVGMSIGYVVREAECSVCGADPDLCPHVTGRVYGGRPCFRVIKRADLLEVSLVPRPEHPDARITAVSVPLADLREQLGERFVPGMRVSCDRCLRPCAGVVELEVTT